MAAELGQSLDPKTLIPGEPLLLSGDLRKLVQNIEKMSAISEGLAAISPQEWTGDASDAFREVFGKEPQKWIDTIGILGKGADALADYGDTLTWAQSEAQRAIELFTQSQAASRAAAADYNVQAQQAASLGQEMYPFADPGQSGTAQAQEVLGGARNRLEEVGAGIAELLGFSPEDDGTYSKELGKESADKGKKSEWERGNQSDGMLTDKVDGVLKLLGIDTHDETSAASASASVAEGKTNGSFGSDLFGGSGKMGGAVLGADASAHGSMNSLGMSGDASAEAYLAKGSAAGELHGPKHVSVSGSADGAIDAHASASGSLGWTGGKAQIGAGIGAHVGADAGAEVGGVKAGVHGGLRAGFSADASAQFGMGDDGKFHVGASAGLSVGIGGELSFNIAIDPKEVASTVHDVSNAVGTVADSVGNAVSGASHDIADSVNAVGRTLGF
ncbi:putative T7SS-secreted protein [Amycolatopsis sp. NPDC004079]|uniref:putative T7SS-secreted protein n=1 Tax=Amycolatopsis sp. NPDC004079 TaxID=3154549 RepID=UPI0033BF5047